MQDYCNMPMTSGDAFLPSELVLAAESPEAAIEWDGQVQPGLCAGFDVARKRDLSCIVIGVPIADLIIVRGVIWMRAMKFADQRKVAEDVASVIDLAGGKFAVDSTGIGAQIAEELQDKYACVEPVQFATRVDTGAKNDDGEPVTTPVKERMASELKRAFEDGRLRIPESPAIRRACAAIKRYVGPTGAIRFDAARSDAGHADEFWALALMVSAASGPRNYVPASTVGLVGRSMMAGLIERSF